MRLRQRFQSTAIVVLLLCALGSPAWGDRVDADGRPLADRPDLQRSGSLQARLALTQDEKELRRRWNTSSTPPSLPVTESARRGTDISTVLVFQGCTADAAGRCDLAVAFAVVDPKGQRTPAGGGVLWNSAPLPGRMLLGSASLSLGFTSADSPGTYQIHARVVDRVSSRTLELTTPLQLTAD